MMRKILTERSTPVEASSIQPFSDQTNESEVICGLRRQSGVADTASGLRKNKADRGMRQSSVTVTSHAEVCVGAVTRDLNATAPTKQIQSAAVTSVTFRTSCILGAPRTLPINIIAAKKDSDERPKRNGANGLVR